MNHWSVDIEKFKKHEKKFRLWEMEHRINYGLGGRKLHKRSVKHALHQLHIDPLYKRALQFFLRND